MQVHDIQVENLIASKQEIFFGGGGGYQNLVVKFWFVNF